uniref:Ig-like domain-containing protein n=1 Tax=Strix occidentalis caurina TaxID=311401 RepID=A0A8D0FT93_STROC
PSPVVAIVGSFFTSFRQSRIVWETPVDQTGVSGGVASFICQATGDPRPKIVWNKKGKKVSNQRFEVIEFDDGSGSVLRIQPLRTPRDEAIYECVASNSVGEISVSTRLTVLRGKFFLNITNLIHRVESAVLL